MSDKQSEQYKGTLNLVETTLSMRANAPVKELETQKFWEENHIYEKIMNRNPKSNKFILHDGPPYLSSEKIHIGTALNKILKDIVLRYKSQKGFYAPYVPGYDGHGLPIENAVVKNIKGGRDAVSRYEFRQKCREFAHKNLKGQETNFKRLGILGDWEHPYLTINSEYEAEQIRIFGEMYKKGLIEKGLKAVYWCTDCETALAEAEVEYADHTSTSIFVKFLFEKDAQKVIKEKANIKTDKPIYSVIWTTTPWTIPSNRAISLNPKYVYSLLECKNEIFVVAQDLVKNFLTEAEIDENSVTEIGTVVGSELELLNTIHPLYPEIKSPILLGDHVTLDAGTGCVHTAPGHGLEDWEVGVKYGIEVFSPIDEKGLWTDAVPDMKGIHYSKGNAIVIEKLEAKGALLSKKDISHSYPHCWRCKKPLIYRATSQWFVKMDKFRKDVLDEVKKVKWIPDSGEIRMGNMVKNRSDWCISRQRTWGVPIPVFFCKECGETIVTDETINYVANLVEKESSDVWDKYLVKELLPPNFKCPKCGKQHFRKETDIMDVWFDSGVSHTAVVEKRNEQLGHLPVEMYLEGTDQHRGWFQTSLLTSVALTGKAPYKLVLTHGFVVDGEGRKMSKSLGNFIAPQDIIKIYGTDILRLWAASLDYRNDVRIGDTIVKQLVEIFKKTRNTMRYLLGNIYDFNPKTDYVEYANLTSIDKFALHKLNVLVKSITDSFENYEFYKYFQYLQNFAAVDLSAFYLDIIKDRLYTSGKNSLSRRAAQTVLYELSQALVRILVPVMPHQAEDIWQNMIPEQKCGIESALLTDFPEVNQDWFDEELEKEFTQILKLREIVSRAIEPLRVDKVVGSSLEVGVVVVENEKSDLLAKYESELANIFITSQATVSDKQPSVEILNEYKEDNYTIYIVKAEGEKCVRCWKYRVLGENKNYPDICIDCAKAIEDK